MSREVLLNCLQSSYHSLWPLVSSRCSNEVSKRLIWTSDGCPRSLGTSSISSGSMVYIVWYLVEIIVRTVALYLPFPNCAINLENLQLRIHRGIWQYLHLPPLPPSQDNLRISTNYLKPNEIISNSRRDCTLGSGRTLSARSFGSMVNYPQNKTHKNTWATHPVR